MPKPKEDFRVDIREIEKKKVPIIIDIPINSTGIGEATFKANGYLEQVILPQKMLSNYNILCVSSSQPQDIVFNITEPKHSIYYIRHQNHDEKGGLIDYFSKKCLSGSYTIRVAQGTPASMFQIILVVS